METPKSIYSTDISLMMFGFGDSRFPNPQTVSLVETIVLKQLRTIIQEASKYSKDEDDSSFVVTGQQLVFLMRHNNEKMRRFVKFLYNRHLKKTVKSMQTSTVIELDPDEKPTGPLLEFIELIDETGEFTDLSQFDEIKHARDVRADRISQALDEAKYLEFCKARRVSFCSEDKLRMWVDPNEEIRFVDEALLVLAYYAYQTIAEIIDYALLVRLDMKGDADPVSSVSGSYYNAAMFREELRYTVQDKKLENKVDYRRIYSGQPPISVQEIKEVMRRVHSPQAGVLNFGGKLPETHYLFAL